MERLDKGEEHVPVVDEADKLEPVTIDFDEYMEARNHPGVIALLREAEREGAKVEAEGRKRY